MSTGLIRSRHNSQILKAVVEARAARKHAVPPVSRFMVGAAALTSRGGIYPGANVEEAAVNGTIHAELCALTGANAHGDRDVTDLVVCADTTDPTRFVSPCPHCWQFITSFAEMLGHRIVIISVRSTGEDRAVVSTDGPPPPVFAYSDIGVDLSLWRPPRRKRRRKE